MPKLDVIILCSNMELKKEKMSSSDTHLHYKHGCYLNIMGSGLKSPDGMTPPFLLFQEGNTLPFACERADDDLMEKTYTVPRLRAVAKARGGTGLNLGKYLNVKTLPIIFIALIILWAFATGGISWSP